MAQSRAHVDKAVADAARGRIAAVRAAGGCARLGAYRARGLKALAESDLDAKALLAEHAVDADAEVDADIEVGECTLRPDGRGLLRMDDSVLMVVSQSACILQAEEESEVFQVQFEKVRGEERITWLSSAELQVELRSEMTIVHIGRELHVVLENGMERVTVIYDEGPVQQAVLTEDGRAGVRLREAEQDAQGVTLEQAKSRRAEVTALRDQVKDSMPSAKEAVEAAEAMLARAKLAREAAAEKEKAFKAARAKAVSKEHGDGPLDVALEDGFLAKVSSKRVEVVQLPKKFDSAQLQWGNDGEWTWGCNGGIISTRGDGTALVKLTDDVSPKMKSKLARVQLMPTGDRIVAFEDGSRLQLMKDDTVSFHRDPISLVVSEGFCTCAGNGMRSRLEDKGNCIHEEDSGLSWALDGDELVILSAGNSFPESPKGEKPKEAAAKKKPAKTENKDKRKSDTRQGGLVEDAGSGEPLASVNVQARSLSTSKSGFSAARVTDKDGYFDLERSEDVVVCAEKSGYAPEMALLSAKSLASCFRMWPLTTSQTFKSQAGITLTHEGCCLHVRPGAVKNSDGSSHTATTRLDLGLPSSEDGLRLYAGIADAEKEKDGALDSEVRITLKTMATLRDGAPLPIAWTLDGDAARKQLPTIKRKSFVFRSVFDLPGVYRDLETSNTIKLEVECSVRPLLRRVYQGASSGKALLDEPRLHIAYTARELMVCGIVEVTDDEVPEVTPALLEEAKKESPLQSALEKCRIKEVRLKTTYETIVDWVSSGIYVDGIELPSVDDEVLMAAHEEVQLVRSFKDVAAGLSRAGSLLKEAEAAAKLKTLPSSLAKVASACLSLFTEAKKTAEQVGGFNYFQKQVKSGLLGRCAYLSPYEVSEAVVKRTEQLAKFDEAKLASDYPAGALLAVWVREFVTCALALRKMGVSVNNKKKGHRDQRDFLDVGSPVPALNTLLTPPRKDLRLVEFVAPAPGWWTVDFNSWRAAGGGAAAAKALA